MEPLAAVGLASNIIQIVDFSAKVVSRSKEIYNSADGALGVHAVLQQSSDNLKELTKELKKIDATERRNRSSSTADKQLLTLSSEAMILSGDISSALGNVAKKAKDEGFTNGQNSKNAWKSFQKAFQSVLSEKKLRALETKLEGIRKQIDTALLYSIRERLDQGYGAESREPQTQDENNDFFEEDDRHRYDTVTFIISSNMLETSRHDMARLSQHMLSLAHEDSAKRFFKLVKARLTFSDIPDRLESIPAAYSTTFSWLFDPKKTHEDRFSWNDFTSWLSDSKVEGLYWITGKPGSGKSTLMKYIFNNLRTYELLRTWSSHMPLSTAGFFFWNSGSKIQMSRLGFLRSVLLESLEKMTMSEENTESAQKLFPERWSHFEAYGGGRYPFTWPELRRAFESLISDPTKRFFFAFDGLDEFDGDPVDLVDFVVNAARNPNVKICVSSRPWLVFEKAFENRPSLKLEHLTRQDIKLYVKGRLNSDKYFNQFAHREPSHARALMDNVVNKAAGVFLWVYLVVDSLVQGLANADRLSDLQFRLDSLPGDLEHLFEKLLNTVEPEYFRHSCELFRLVEDSVYPSLLLLSFADDHESQSSMSAKVKPIPFLELEGRAEEMRRRLQSRCKGLLEIYQRPTDQQFSRRKLKQSLFVQRPTIEKLRVRYLHRTARDFLHLPRHWERILEATGHNSFNPTERWANGVLGYLKGTCPILKENLSIWNIWTPMTLCIEHAIRLQQQDGKVRMTYLDEVGRVVVNEHKRTWEMGHAVVPDGFYSTELKTFLDIAALLCLVDYIKLKIGMLTKDEVENAIQFAHSPARSVFSQGKEQWLGERTILQDAYQDSATVDEILRYYQKSSFSKAFRPKPYSSLPAYI